ncbi:MAG: transferase [Proteobacteria bacterium]|nr:transferase [Pseudomonadota bacterium]
MQALEKLLDRIIQRVNINLRELGFDVTPYVRELIPRMQMFKFYAFYGITPHHPLNFQFTHSNLAGSYFLGKCRVTNSLLYKSDIRGDELKKKGTVFQFQEFEIPITRDEQIDIEDSFLIKTLVHNYSHDPETLEKFFIKDTISMHYANIHGSPSDGCFLGPFSTVDMTTMHDCVIGAFSYIQAGEISHKKIDPGTVWVRSPDNFNFLYRYEYNRLNKYINFTAGNRPKGLLFDFVEDHKKEFERVFALVNIETPRSVPGSASLDRYAVIKPHTKISENVLVAQRAYLQNAWLGKGANAQENCYIINSRLEGYDITAHGGKIVEADLGKKVFVGFNSFLRGRPDARLTIGKDSIVMPHTIIDISNPLTIPPDHIIWGLVTNKHDLETNSMPINDFSKIETKFSLGNMIFEGNGASFVSAFRHRIDHILEANGAFFNGAENKGHAQKNQSISFNTIQPYPMGELKGLYPSIIIQP